MKTNLLIKESSFRSLEEVCELLPEVVTKHQFGVLTTHDLRETMRRKGVEFERECRIFEVCNPNRAREVLLQNMEIATALPCRIAVYCEEDATILTTLKPTAMLDLYDATEVAGVAEEVERTMVAVMKEAAQI